MLTIEPGKVKGREYLGREHLGREYLPGKVRGCEHLPGKVRGCEHLDLKKRRVRVADLTFYYLMLGAGVPTWRANLAYKAVKVVEELNK